jgi:hypothetical protein
MCPRFIFVASNCLATLSFLIREDLPLWLQAHYQCRERAFSAALRKLIR